VEFKILKVAFVVRDFICAKNEILSVKGGGILKNLKTPSYGLIKIYLKNQA
jgi:hypothetical protein